MIIPLFPPDDVNYQFALAMAHSFTTLDLKYMLRSLQASQKFDPTNPAIAASIQAILKHLQDRAANRHDQRWCQISRECRQGKLHSAVDDILRDMLRNRQRGQQIEMELGGRHNG
jgi:hypothetical protein